MDLPNNFSPQEVFEQVKLWSQNREHDLHQLRGLIDDYADGNGLEEPRLRPDSKVALLIKIFKDLYQENKFIICSCLIGILAVFIAIFIGLLLGVVTIQGFLAINGFSLEFTANIENPPKHNNVELTATCTDEKKCPVARDCKEWYEVGINKSGIYPIKPDDGPSFQVYCDMETEGGGWTVFQRRQDGSVNFYRNWTDYEDGFSTLSGEHWLGLSKLHRLTPDTSNTLRVDLEDFSSNTAYAQYNTFQISDFNSQYAITVCGYNGTAGDSLGGHNTMKFSTEDKDNDIYNGNCAKQFKGAWWYTQCVHAACLNGQYKPTSATDHGHGVLWLHWKGLNYSLKFSEMKLRRN